MSGRMTIGTALVTAGANGLGRATALCLAEEGVRVALVDRDAAGLDEAASTIRAVGGDVHTWIADCVDPLSISETAALVSDRLGRVDALVNNMGGSAGADIAAFEDQSLAVIERVIDQCLVSAFAWTRALVPGMLAHGYGKVVNIISDSPFAVDHHMAEYAAAKLGMVGMTRVLAKEYAMRGITVNAVGPGPTRTAAIARVAEDVIAAAIAEIPMGRLGEPRDIGKTVAFFCSSDADYVTGQHLLVNGGRAHN